MQLLTANIYEKKGFGNAFLLSKEWCPVLRHVQEMYTCIIHQNSGPCWTFYWVKLLCKFPFHFLFFYGGGGGGGCTFYACVSPNLIFHFHLVLLSDNSMTLCTICDNTKWQILNSVPVGKNTSDGSAIPCKSENSEIGKTLLPEAESVNQWIAFQAL